MIKSNTWNANKCNIQVGSIPAWLFQGLKLEQASLKTYFYSLNPMGTRPIWEYTKGTKPVQGIPQKI